MERNFNLGNLGLDWTYGDSNPGPFTDTFLETDAKRKSYQTRP